MAKEASQLDLDRALARQVAAGDQAAFDAFFREYFPRLYRFTLLRVGNDPDLAEEIVQRTMCVVVRKMGAYRGEALLFTWLCQICRNETASLYRKERISIQEDIPIDDHPAVQAALESLAGQDFRPDTAIRNSEIANFVRATLDYLPSNYAIALEMKYVHGASVREIAERLQVGEKAAESVLSRARAAFKEGFRTLWNFESTLMFD